MTVEDEKPFSYYSGEVVSINRHEDNLKKTLNDEEKIIFEKFAECTNEMYGIAEREAIRAKMMSGVSIAVTKLRCTLHTTPLAYFVNIMVWS